MNAPDRLRALLAEPGFVTMPAVWDGLSAKLAAGAGFKTAFLSGSCVAASRLGGPDLDLLFITTMFYNLTPEQLATQPLAGRLFVAHPGVKGLPEPAFAG